MIYDMIYIYMCICICICTYQGRKYIASLRPGSSPGSGSGKLPSPVRPASSFCVTAERFSLNPESYTVAFIPSNGASCSGPAGSGLGVISPNHPEVYISLVETPNSYTKRNNIPQENSRNVYSKYN